jgi:hypothetical protein
MMDTPTCMLDTWIRAYVYVLDRWIRAYVYVLDTRIQDVDTRIQPTTNCAYISTYISTYTSIIDPEYTLSEHTKRHKPPMYRITSDSQTASRAGDVDTPRSEAKRKARGAVTRIHVFVRTDRHGNRQS